MEFDRKALQAPAKAVDVPVGEVDLEFLKEEAMVRSFIEESFEHLESIEVSIIDLEKEENPLDTVNKIFRSFHTIKGIATCLHLDDLSELAHVVESLLDDVRNGRRPMDTEVIDAILSAGDNLRAMVMNIKEAFEEGPEHYEYFDVREIILHIKAILHEEETPAAAPEPIAETAAPPEPLPAPVEAEEVPMLDLTQDLDLLGGFVEEASEHLEAIEVNVLDLEQNPDDMEIINNIFRPFHTIKGVSGFLNLKTINKLAHTTENLLDDVRNGVREMSPEIIDVVLSVGDCLRSMIENIKEVMESGQARCKEFDISEYVERVGRIRSGDDSQAGTGEVPPAKTSPPPVEEPPPAPSEATPAPVESPPVASLPVESVPAPPPPPAEPTPVESVAAAPPPPPPPPPVTPAPAAAKHGPVGSAPPPPPSSLGGPPGGAGAQPKADKIGVSIKVGVEKLDALVNAVGELVIMQSLVQENPLIRGISDPKLTKDFSQLGRITSELQKTAMSMRMVPIRQTFQKMIRLVRDLSKKSGKQVDLKMSGEETEIDRNMVDSIYDPLVHMIRNSVDHGVKTPSEREKDGKSPVGTVNLRAYQKGGNMVIEIEDDGDGLNPEKIKQKAIERNLIGMDDFMSDYELNNLIFLPGFSTAEKITDVSGRGVGMDVVKKAVEKMRGKVDVVSEQGKGSLFVIRLPLTLAIIDGIIVRVGTERYIIPTVSINESLKPEEENYNTVYGKGETLMIRNNLVPIIRLYQTFDVKPDFEEPCDAILVVVETEGRRRAIMVDELLGKQEVVIKNLGGLKSIPGVAGGTILGDGRVGLILDLAGLIIDKGKSSQSEQKEKEVGKEDKAEE